MKTNRKTAMIRKIQDLKLKFQDEQALIRVADELEDSWAAYAREMYRQGRLDALAELSEKGKKQKT